MWEFGCVLLRVIAAKTVTISLAPLLFSVLVLSFGGCVFLSLSLSLSLFLSLFG